MSVHDSRSSAPQDRQKRSLVASKESRINTDMSSWTGRYHWALLVGPKKDKKKSRAVLHHAQERLRESEIGTEFFYDRRDVPTGATYMSLVRVMIGKVEKKDVLADTIKGVQIRNEDPEWNCVIWVKEALEALLLAGALGTNNAAWAKVRETVMWYMEKKKEEHRYDGQGGFDMDKPATFDMLKDKETIP
jgi:hypothetical protein